MIATFISLLLICLITGKEFPYKGLVAFVAGLSYPVPVIGIIATSILGGVLGFVSEGIGFGIVVLVVINVVNIIIDRTVQPRLMSDAIGVSELFVMFAAFAGGEVAGVWGMLLGIPVAAMGKTLFEWFHLNFLLVDEPVVEGHAQHIPQEEPVPAGTPAQLAPPPVVVQASAESLVFTPHEPAEKARSVDETGKEPVVAVIVPKEEVRPDLVEAAPTSATEIAVKTQPGVPAEAHPELVVEKADHEKSSSLPTRRLQTPPSVPPANPDRTADPVAEPSPPPGPALNASPGAAKKSKKKGK
jgi:hypothetical protein